MLAALPRFPCRNDKRPLTGRGFYDARADVDDRGWPLVGVPTGSTTGLDVLDIDVAGLDWFNRQHLPLTRMHQTRSGGIHLFFRHAQGLRGSVGRIAVGVDTRANGNYVVWWPRQGLKVCEAPIAEWPGWLLELAMGPGSRRDLRRKPVPCRVMPSGGELSRLDVTEYRNRDDWLRLMMSCHAAGIEREVFIEWSTSDPVYANDWAEIERQWDALRPDGGITGWALRVEIRLAELNKGICPKHRPSKQHSMQHRAPTSQVPLCVETKNLQRRVSSLLDQVSKGQEPLLFWAACVMREIIAEGKLHPRVAVQLLEGSWPKRKNPTVDARRVIAAGFLTVEDKL